MVRAWTAKPLSLSHVRAVVIAETHLAEMMQLLCGALRDALADRTSSYPKLHWQDLRSADVIVAFTIGALVRRHMVAGMPAEIAALPPSTIRWFYWETLMLVAAVDAQQAMTDPLDLARLAAECDLGLPWLAAEFGRRSKREPAGVRAAVILMNRYLEKDSIEKGIVPGPADDGRLRRYAWEQLTNMAMRHLPKPKSEAKSEDRETDREEVAQYIAEVMLRRWGPLHPLRALALALDGRMRILPKSAANRAQNDRKKKWVQRERELKVGFEAIYPAGFASPEDRLERKESENREQGRLELVLQDPRAADILGALKALDGDGAPKTGWKDVADKMGITPRTLRNRLDRLRQHFPE